MTKYQVNFYDHRNGATSAIDIITAADDYTPEQYISDCKDNAPESWNEMLSHGTIDLIEIG